MNKEYTKIKLNQILFILIGLTVSQTLHSQNKINWDTDLDYICSELPKKHINLFNQKDGYSFSKSIERLKAESKNKNDFDMAIGVQQLIASLGDSHTQFNFQALVDKKQILPLQTYWYSDGLYVTHTTKEYAEILGCQILSFNNISIETMTDSLSSLITVDNQANIKLVIPQYIPSLQILKYFNFTASDEVKVSYRSSNGEKRSTIIKPKSVNKENVAIITPKYNPDSLALCYKNQNYFFTENYISENQTYYLQYNKCWSKELEMQFGNKKKAEQLPSFKEFEEKVFEKLKTAPVNKLIFDLRLNGGGNSKQGTDFIRKLASHFNENPEIKIYVVLGRSTFSSAILNALDFKAMTKAIFVGEETAGKPNHFGEVRSFLLPSSKLKVSYSTKYFKRTDEEVNSLTPDVIIETSFSDFMKGIDPVYEWIKKQ